MRKLLLAAILLVLLLEFSRAQSKPSATDQVVMHARELSWKPLIPGFEMSVVSGDPSKAGIYVLRIRSQKGARIAPHWHPEDEAVTVLAGEFRLGHGEKYDPRQMRPLRPGDFATVPARMAHYGYASAGCIVQVHGMGPFVVNWVNPEDDPAKQAPAK
ncbi:MAG TPA: cupin domain-containing protein [Terriglobales bacterium]|nr:cupin domain-containing protein [Terriglobales bacterium]